MSIRILDDIYWSRIYEELHKILPELNYPVKENINSPIPYLADIKNWDIILLDNYFPWDYREEPLWDDFLRQYLKLNLDCKIICLSNVGQKITQRFEQRCLAYNRWDIIGFVSDKNPDEIAEIIRPFIKTHDKHSI